jgi:outer membrane protein OmpA-like peptidoglycan-associated protein
MWINQTKLFDLPRLMATDVKYNVLRFETYSINTSKPYEVLISNIKLAEGTVYTRSKLITEGKLVTNAITFDSGSDKIKPESYSMLKSIAEALTANPTVNIMIIGHTDTDGNSANNQTLSEARSIAVKNSLIKDFGIQESRIQTSGKGDKEPVAENTSSEGKAKNRRVEFNKM